jgi:alpha-glucosidase (family GH31 glycosyl hydrolase)
MHSGRIEKIEAVRTIASLFFVAFAQVCVVAAPIQSGSAPSELVISEVSERMVRIELAPLDEQGRPRAGTLSTVLVPFPVVEKLRRRELTSEKEIRAGKLRVTIKPQPLAFTIRRADGKLVQELIFDDGTNSVVKFRTDAPVLGLGEGATQFDRRGTNFTMLNGQRAPFLATHGGTIPVPFLIGTDGWALFVHRPWGEFDLRDGGKFIPLKASQGKETLEIYVISMDEPVDALTEYLRLTGKPVMPPKWVMGYMQSHRTLAGPDEPLQIAKTFREKKLPCDAVIYLGTGYCTNGWNVMNGTIDFNTNAFPKPAEQIKALQAEHFKVILHVNQAPRNLFGTTIGPPAAPASTELFSRGRYLQPGQGRGATSAADAPEDFNAPLHIRNYWAWHKPVFALGIDGWWPDDGDELPIEARLARHRCYYEGSLQERPNERPWALHRNGFAGVQRYGGWIWSGDVQSRWATLAAHVPVGVNYSLSLTPFWGTDTGGFIPTRDLTGELYVRWFQFSTFNPLMRSHGRTWKLRLPWGWNTGEAGPVEERVVPDSSELHNAEVELICKKFLELRYRLLPYNYTLMREACDTGLPPMRALWLHHANDAEAVKLGNEYLWGRDILVAPVVEKGAKARRVYLPAGTWFDWWTGKKVEGKKWIEREVDLATMPLYIRAGAIVPLDPVRQYTSQPVTEPTMLRIHPGANGAFTLYDDDGQSLGYRDSLDAKIIWIRVRWDDAARRLTLEPDERMKKWSGGPREFAVEIKGNDAKSKRVEFKGERVEVTL